MESGGDTARDRRSAQWGHAGATFRLPHFSLLWSSNLLQFVATSLVAVVFQWLVTSLTESRTVVGLVGFVQGATIVLASPMAGVAVDRLSKRHLLMGGRLGLAALVCAVAALIAAGQIEIWHILVASVVGGLLAALMQPATSLNAGATVVTLAPMGGLLAGMLADAIGDQGAMAVFGAIPTVLLAALLVMGWRELRQL